MIGGEGWSFRCPGVCVCVRGRRLDRVDGDGLGAGGLWDADSGERCR